MNLSCKKARGTDRSIRMLAIVVAFVWVIPASLRAQFEGVVESTNVTTDETGARQEFVMTMWIKNAMIKIQTSGIGAQPGTTLIYRNDRHVVWIINDVDKTYTEMRREEGTSDSVTHEKPDRRRSPVIKKTGKTRKILGYRCEEVIVKTEGEETQIWGTRSLGGLATTITNAFGIEPSDGGGVWTDDLRSLGLFPLIASIKIDGNVVESQKVTRIDKRPLPDDLFEIPSDYRRQNVGDLLK